MYCKIDCQTLDCERCKKKISDCEIVRNCIIDEPKKIIQRDNLTEKIGAKPGTELKKLLFRIGIDSTSGCKCSDRAKHIDYMEQVDPGWAERNIDEIVEWMEQEARNRGLPFIRFGAKLLVKLAIRRSKK